MRLLKSFFVILLAYICLAEKFSYNGYKLLRLYTDTDEKSHFINDLEGEDPDVRILKENSFTKY